MGDTIIVRAPNQDIADTMNSSISAEDTVIDALLTEAENRMREKATSTSVSKHEKVSIPRFPKLEPSSSIVPYIKKGVGGTVFMTEDARKAKNPSRRHGKSTELPFMRVNDPMRVQKEMKEKRDKTAGADWYHLPKTEITPQVKRDLQMIKLRNVLDPHKHFKGNDSNELPKYFQMGTIVEGPTEYYSARINRKERKKSIVDEILASSQNKSRFKKKYDEIQAKKRSGKKDFYKKLKAQRKKGKFGF